MGKGKGPAIKEEKKKKNSTANKLEGGGVKGLNGLNFFCGIPKSSQPVEKIRIRKGNVY